MKNVKGWWLPEYDTHFEKFIHGGQYQEHSRNYSLQYTDSFDLAIDIGANVGFWTKPLCEKFKQVNCFEPVVENRQCLAKNVSMNNYTLYDTALGKEQLESQPIYMNKSQSGSASLDETKASKNSGKTTSVSTLDSFHFKNVSYIKIDVQGTEKNVILGAIRTLQENNVCLVVELPQRTSDEKLYHKEVTDVLRQIGYRRVGNYRKEVIFKK